MRLYAGQLGESDGEGEGWPDSREGSSGTAMEGQGAVGDAAGSSGETGTQRTVMQVGPGAGPRASRRDMSNQSSLGGDDVSREIFGLLLPGAASVNEIDLTGDMGYMGEGDEGGEESDGRMSSSGLQLAHAGWRSVGSGGRPEGSTPVSRLVSVGGTESLSGSGSGSEGSGIGAHAPVRR